MGLAEQQHSQAGALHVIRGRAKQKSEGKPEQRCRDDTSCSSNMITQSVRQSPNTQGVVARYVGVPIGNYIVTNLTNKNPGTTGDEKIVRAEQEHSQEIEMGRDEHQHSQAGVLLASHGRAEHLPLGVELSQELEMGQAEHHHSQAGVLHASHGRAEHLPEGVELSQESEMGQAEHQYSQAGVLHGHD